MAIDRVTVDDVQVLDVDSGAFAAVDPEPPAAEELLRDWSTAEPGHVRAGTTTGRESLVHNPCNELRLPESSVCEIEIPQPKLLPSVRNRLLTVAFEIIRRSPYIPNSYRSEFDTHTELWLVNVLEGEQIYIASRDENWTLQIRAVLFQNRPCLRAVFYNAMEFEATHQSFLDAPERLVPWLDAVFQQFDYRMCDENEETRSRVIQLD